MGLVDVAIIAVLVLYAVVGYRSGFINQTAELVSFVVGFALAFLLYGTIAGAVAGWLHLPRNLVGLVVFLALWMGIELALAYGWRHLKRRIPEQFDQAPANHLAGIAPGIVKGVVLATIVLLIIATAPFPASAKAPFINGPIGKALLAAGTGVQQQFNNLFGSVLQDTLAFKTIKTTGDTNTPLGFTHTGGQVCRDDEQSMIDLVNRERTSRGLRPVSEDDQLREVGRAHSRDMLARGYFSHVSPDGLDPFDRMERAGIKYLVAGENLAFAPTVGIAHTGLMNSPGHRANILQGDYSRLGVGCIDAGIHGLMFSQEFAG